MLGLPEISGNTQHFGLPATRWSSKLNQVRSGIEKIPGLDTRWALLVDQHQFTIVILQEFCYLPPFVSCHCEALESANLGCFPMVGIIWGIFIIDIMGLHIWVVLIGQWSLPHYDWQINEGWGGWGSTFFLSIYDLQQWNTLRIIRCLRFVPIGPNIVTSFVIIRSSAAYQHMSLNMSNERCPQKDLSSHLSFFAIEVINCWRMLLEIVSWMRRSHLGYSLRYCPQIVPTIIFEIFSWLLSLRGTKIRRSKMEDHFPIVHYNR